MQNGIGYTFLSDQELAAIKAWGLVNPDNPSVPHPTAVIVDDKGIIRYWRQDVDFTKRPPSAELLDAVDRLAELSEDPG